MKVATHSLSLGAVSQHYRGEEEKLSLASSVQPFQQIEDGAGTADDALAEVDPKLRIMALLLEALTGQKISLTAFHSNSNVSDTANTALVPRENSPILEYQYHKEELNSMNFSAEGKVLLKDGSMKTFSLSIKWEQSFSESLRLRIQDGKILTDPLVISLDGTQPLSSNAFAFNLNGESGQSLPYLTGRAGYLAYDADQDGKITSGSELFGPKSGKGFMELSAYDEDRNGWIDGNDSFFKQLRVWTITEGSESLLSLEEVGIGAISLQTTNVDFTLKRAIDDPIAHYKKASVAVGENGEAYGLFEIDVAV